MENAKCRSNSLRRYFIVLLFVLTFCISGILASNEGKLPNTPNIRTVVTTECDQYLLWQLQGLLHSHEKVRQPGPISLIFTCSEQELSQFEFLHTQHADAFFAKASYHLGHPVTKDLYFAYDRAAGLTEWFASVEPEEEYLLLVEQDMLFFSPVHLEDFPDVREGHPTGAYYWYMTGVANNLSDHFLLSKVEPRTDHLAGPVGRRADMVGYPVIIHKHDLKKIAPLWYTYTEAIRQEGHMILNEPNPIWIADMYGYSYAAAELDIWHEEVNQLWGPVFEQQTRFDEEPKLVHLCFNLKVGDYEWGKHKSNQFVYNKCPPWNLNATGTEPGAGGLFRHPPHPATLRPSTRSAKMSGMLYIQQLYIVKIINTYNEAFCQVHLEECPPSEELERECKKVASIAAAVEVGMREARQWQAGMRMLCKNTAGDEFCEKFANEGKCFISGRGDCALACGYCKTVAQAGFSVGSHDRLSDAKRAALKQGLQQGAKREPDTDKEEAPIVQEESLTRLRIAIGSKRSNVPSDGVDTSRFQGYHIDSLSTVIGCIIGVSAVFLFMLLRKKRQPLRRKP